MKNFFTDFDFLILLPVLFLLILGLAIVWSVSPSLFPQQLLFVITGLFCFFIFSKINYQIYKNLSFFIYISGVLLLLLTMIIGQISRGSVRWIVIGNFFFQPSEFFKPVLIIFSADYLSSRGINNLKSRLLYFLLFFIPTFMVFKQPDFGNVIVYLAIFSGIIIFSGIKWYYYLSNVIFLIFSSPLIWHFLKNYQRQRIMTFLNPLADPLGRGYNILQSIVAVGSGGLFGRGLGRGTQSHLRFLPEYHTDFIFASLSEELGFLGASLLILFYGFLLVRILKINRNLEDRFAKTMTIGIFIMIFTQTFINMGMNIGLLPITGITLPLISYGGSSIVATLISLGILENIAANNPKKEIIEIR